jgi:diguanylate cyclase (GGDEF)-like protein
MLLREAPRAVNRMTAVSALLPTPEDSRVAALRSYGALDASCEAALAELAQLATQVTGFPAAMVNLVDRAEQQCRASFGLDLGTIPRAMSFCAHALEQPDRPLVVPDTTLDARFHANPLVSGRPGIRAYAGAPLVTADGHALGTLCVVDTRARQPEPAALGMLASLARAVVTTLELRRAMRQAEELALTDPLTGLPNRTALTTALGQAIARQRRDGQPFSLLYLDLDGMKRLNDLEGHRVGDIALREAGTALLLCVRQEDTPARLGGDEFAALLVGGDGAEAAVVAERVRHAVQATMQAYGWPITASVGAACFLAPPDDEEAALSIADGLMYAAKSGGRNRVVCRDHAPATLGNVA